MLGSILLGHCWGLVANKTDTDLTDVRIFDMFRFQHYFNFSLFVRIVKRRQTMGPAHYQLEEADKWGRGRGAVVEGDAQVFCLWGWLDLAVVYGVCVCGVCFLMRLLNNCHLRLKLRLLNLI